MQNLRMQNKKRLKRHARQVDRDERWIKKSDEQSDDRK